VRVGFAIATALCLSSAVLVAETQEETLRYAVEKLEKAFGGFEARALEDLRADTERRAEQEFLAGIELVGVIAGSGGISEPIRRELMIRVAEATGGFFERFTEPFADPVRQPPPWSELAGRHGKFLGSLKWAGLRLVWIGEFMWRDLWRVLPFSKSAELGWHPHWPHVFPFLGTDSQRSAASAVMMAHFVKALEGELSESARRAEAGNLSLAGLRALLDRMNHAEPLRYGPVHEKVRRIFIGIAVFCFLNPPIDPFPLVWQDRTSVSPLVSAISQAGIFLYGARVRRKDSGLDAYRTLRKALRRIERDPARKEAWDRCATRLADES